MARRSGAQGPPRTASCEVEKEASSSNAQNLDRISVMVLSQPHPQPDSQPYLDSAVIIGVANWLSNHPEPPKPGPEPTQPEHPVIPPLGKSPHKRRLREHAKQNWQRQEKEYEEQYKAWIEADEKYTAWRSAKEKYSQETSARVCAERREMEEKERKRREERERNERAARKGERRKVEAAGVNNDRWNDQNSDESDEEVDQLATPQASSSKRKASSPCQRCEDDGEDCLPPIKPNSVSCVRCNKMKKRCSFNGPMIGKRPRVEGKLDRVVESGPGNSKTEDEIEVVEDSEGEEEHQNEEDLTKKFILNEVKEMRGLVREFDRKLVAIERNL
ncbi:hypothetical protein D9758_011804 [Tetrapyrgos nigripes]|uniref:Zn(2)-C6 fungal-type domain-containing protein n=1 Tax=Tetrapyrgos nigripes TaxID=182062 RepID=A0A8H5CZB0_9AGAR|nr:hypothetical protein D9758_011804 [Tetrapyrgos nigripes]